jgi:predicted RNA methylase
VNDLKTITKKILSNYQNAKINCQKLKELFQKTIVLENGHEVSTEHGLALSTKHAADCIMDFQRTSQFIRGINEAINKLIQTNSRIDVLYSGSGPYGTLLIPLLSIYNPSLFQSIHLIEINTVSAKTLKKTLNYFDLSSFNTQIFNMNVLEYQSDVKFDLIICETMFQGLIREPQVALTRYLSGFLKPKGIFIPEKINLYSGFSKLENETVFFDKIHKDPKRKGMNLLWSLNIPFQKPLPDWKDIPVDIVQGDELNIFTKVHVYSKIQIDFGESLITNPICLHSDFGESQKYKLKYIENSSPHWTVELK